MYKDGNLTTSEGLSPTCVRRSYNVCLMDKNECCSPV